MPDSPDRADVRPADPSVHIVPVDDPGWLSLTASSPQATCFHDPQWSRLLTECYGFRSFVAVLRDPDGSAVAGMPILAVKHPLGRTRWISLPFSDECAPITRRDSDLRPLLHGLDELRRAAGITDLEIRAALPGPGIQQTLAGSLHVLRLPDDPEQLRRQLRPAARRHVNKAGRSGLEVIHGDGQADLVKSFYRLHLATRQRQGVPVQPRRYFRLLWSRMLATERGFVVLARHRGIPVAGAVFLLGNRTVTYKYGASLDREWDLRPNHAVMWDALRWACERGYSTFDFGRTDPGHDGLGQFKQSWGAEGRPLRYSQTGEAGGRAQAGRAGRLLRPVIQRSPGWLCRSLGELLYRYAA